MALPFLILGIALGDSPNVEEWPAWRGGQRHGAVASSVGPINWSGIDDAQWVATIPGRGNSSPIVASGRVYVTTAFKSRETEQWNEAWTTLRRMLVVATCLLCIFSGVALRNLGSNYEISDLLSNIALATLLLLIGGLELWGDNLLDFERCIIRRWLGSSLMATLCIAVACHRLQPPSPFLLGVGLASLVFGGIVIAGVPSRHHAFRGGLFANNGCMVLTVGLLPVILGLACTCNCLVAKGAKAPVRGIWLVNIALAIALFLWLLGVIWILVKDQQLKAGLSQPASGLWMLGVPLALVLCAFFLVLVAPAKSVVPSTSRRIVDLGNISLVLVGVATALILTYFIVRLAIQMSPFLVYHFSNVKLNWQFTWNAPSGLLACIVPASFVALLWWRAPNTIQASGRWCAIFLALVAFAERNYLTAQNSLSRAIIAVDAENGKTLWTTSVFRSPQEPLHRDNSPATPTPVVWKERVYAAFASGVACVSVEGEPIWTNREITFRSVYGIGTSPAVDDGVLVVSNLMPMQGYVAALNCDNGEVLWRYDLTVIPRNASGCSRSPQIIDLDGVKTVLIWGYEGITGFELHTGKRLWSWPIDGDRGDMVSNVVADDQRLYCCGHGGLTVFSKLRLADHNAPELWRIRQRGPNVSSPILCNDLLFYVTDQGIANCVDATTGTKCWQTRLKGAHFASLVALGNYVYFCSREGNTTVVRADRKFEYVSTNHLGMETMASFAVLENGFIIRAGDKLMRMCPQ